MRPRRRAWRYSLINESIVKDLPRFEMFRTTPPDSGGIVSSMQSLESSLFLVALGRFPHAFSTAVFALESALKVAIPDKPKATLQNLLVEAMDRSPAIRAIPPQQIKALRDRRNHVVHEGFSPRDDGPCAALLLSTAVPALAGAYRDFYNFDLFDAFDADIAMHVQIAVNACSAAGGADASDATRFTVLLAHYLRVRIQRGLTSAAADASAIQAASIGFAFEKVQRRLEALERQFDASWVTHCPACDEQGVLVCELVAKALHAGRLVISRGYCASCDLAVPPQSADLLNEACRKAAQAETSAVLATYGIAAEGA
jgi:hypothetical protein